MSTIAREPLTEAEPIAVRVWVEKRMVYLELVDGRIFGFPADRFKILSAASDEELTDLRDSDLIGIWADRTDVGNSQEFARQLRRHAKP